MDQVKYKCKICKQMKLWADFGLIKATISRKECKACRKKEKNKAYYAKIKGDQWNERYSEKQKERDELKRIKKKEEKKVQEIELNPTCGDCGCSCYLNDENKCGKDGCKKCGCVCPTY